MNNIIPIGNLINSISMYKLIGLMLMAGGTISFIVILWKMLRGEM